MNLFHWIYSKIARRQTPYPRIVPGMCLQILNLTRETIIATQAEVAETGEKRRKGLLGRKGLSAGAGLWIVPCESVHTFAMKFPIDLVYLDRNRRVKKIRNNVRPWKMSACFSAHSVIELAAGTINDTQTRPGDRLAFRQVPPGEPSPQISAIDWNEV